MNRRPSVFWLRLGLFRLPVLTALILAAACAGRQPQVMVHTSTTAERLPDSLPIDVVEYTWTFFNYGDHIRLSGRVRNNSAEAYQAVSIQATLLDEVGATVAQGRAYVYPAYLRPGAEGSFEFVDMPQRSGGQNLPNGRLTTRAFVRQAQ